jgi:hypothetical protein
MTAGRHLSTHCCCNPHFIVVKEHNLAGRSGSTFGKRQKEQKRQEKRQEKAARRDQRKQDKANGIVQPEDDLEPLMPPEDSDDEGPGLGSV